MNGAWPFDHHLYGYAGPLLHRSLEGMRQPVSLRSGNAVERPAGMPEVDVVIGCMNGMRRAQGILSITRAGMVEMRRRGGGELGADWPSLAAFLDEETPRQSRLFDAHGRRREDADPLRGVTEEWERLATPPEPPVRTWRDRLFGRKP